MPSSLIEHQDNALLREGSNPPRANCARAIVKTSGLPLVVGSVAGFGYAFRSVSGFPADKTHQYCAVTFVGYAVNMLAVPALALAGNWPMAAALMIAERTGRAIHRKE